MVTTSAGTLL